MKALHIRAEYSRMPKGELFYDKVREICEYHDIPHDYNMSEEDFVDMIGQYDVLITTWNNIPIPASLAKKPGKLKYIINLSGSLNEWIPLELTQSKDFVVTNWGDAQAFRVAEGAVALLFAVLKDMPTYVLNTRAGTRGRGDCVGGTLYKARVGIYGMGYIGVRFVDMIKPFNPKIFVFDPYVENLPEGCIRVSSLDELCANTDIFVVHAGRSPETIDSITARHLAMLPDNAVVINTARGELFVQDDLFAEIKSGRIRAGLDVLYFDDKLEPDDPIRQCPNFIFSAHSAGGGNWPVTEGELDLMYEIALDNLRRFKNKQPLKFIMDPVRYMRST